MPFTYCYSIIYMATTVRCESANYKRFAHDASQDPAVYRFPTWAYFLLYGTAFVAYFMCVSV